MEYSGSWGMLLEQDELTVEFFAKIESSEQYGPLIRYNTEAAANLPSWAVSFGDAAGNLLVRVDGGADGEAGFNQCVTGIPFGFGRWRHFGMTIRKYEEGGTVKGKVAIYVDYAKVHEMSVMPPRFTGCGRLLVGWNRGGEKFLDGAIDELRITKGVLSPDEFLRLRGAPGTVVVVR